MYNERIIIVLGTDAERRIFRKQKIAQLAVCIKYLHFVLLRLGVGWAQLDIMQSFVCGQTKHAFSLFFRLAVIHFALGMCHLLNFSYGSVGLRG